MDLSSAQTIETSTGIGPVKSESAHMRDIEEPSAGPGLMMLFENRAVANGKFPSGIVDHLAAESIMELGERSP
jgi:hypothetical protein